MQQNFYDDQDAEEILRLAAQRTTTGGMSQEKLLSMAAELGISPEAVGEAEEIYRREKGDRALKAEFDQVTKREFFSHLWTYLIVNAFLVGLDIFSTHHHFVFWAIYPILGWAIGIAFHFRSAFFRNSADYQQEFEKWKARRGLSATQLAAKFLDENPYDRKGAIEHLHRQHEIRRREAREIVDRHLNR